MSIAGGAQRNHQKPRRREGQQHEDLQQRTAQGRQKKPFRWRGIQVEIQQEEEKGRDEGKRRKTSMLQKMKCLYVLPSCNVMPMPCLHAQRA